MTELSAAEASDLFRADPDRWIDVAIGQVAYRRVGEGPDVLFVHGWPASGATFRGLLPFLASHVTCHVIDLVGAGDSRFDRAATISLANHAEAIRVVVDDLGLTDFAVVGHDSGGMMARQALSGDPRVRSWGLVDTEQSQGAHWRFASFLQVRRIPNFERLLAWVVTKPKLRRTKFVLGDCFHDRSLLSDEFEEFFLEPLSSNPERLWAAGQLLRNFDLATFEDLKKNHARMTQPVQLVWGRDDPFFPLSWTQEMMSTFAGDAQLEVIDNGKLFVHEEFPEQVARALLPALLGD